MSDTGKLDLCKKQNPPLRNSAVKTVKSEWYAIDFETGETRWTEPKFGYASLLPSASKIPYAWNSRGSYPRKQPAFTSIVFQTRLSLD